jgi:hypothetical protein
MTVHVSAQGGVLLASSGSYIQLKPGMMVSSAMVESGGLHRGGFEHIDGQANAKGLTRSSSGGSLLSLQTVGTTTTAAGGHSSVAKPDSDAGSLMLPVDDFALSLDYYSYSGEVCVPFATLRGPHRRCVGLGFAETPLTLTCVIPL